MNARITIDGVSVQVPYFVQDERIGGSWLSTLVDAMSARPKRQFATLLDDITFEAVEGDRIALIGRNGAGKTTLLRTLTGAFPPTSGRIEVVGSCQALLNLSNGFNVEATLIENIFLRATAMGLHAREIGELARRILEFAELTELAGRRMYTLSSGQRMRLGFAIATSVQTEILLLDEWLGTGDAHFVRKARERLTDHVEGSKIVVVASHNTSLTQKLCNKGLVLDKGRLVYFGPLERAMREYGKLYPSQAAAKPKPKADPAKPAAAKPAPAKSAADKPAPAKPAADKTAADKPAADKPAKQGASKPAESKAAPVPSTTKQAAAKPKPEAAPPAAGPAIAADAAPPSKGPATATAAAEPATNSSQQAAR